MVDRLELPDELTSLIEKRENEERRREERREQQGVAPPDLERRAKGDRRSADRRDTD